MRPDVLPEYAKYLDLPGRQAYHSASRSQQCPSTHDRLGTGVHLALCCSLALAHQGFSPWGLVMENFQALTANSAVVEPPALCWYFLDKALDPDQRRKN